MFIKAPCGGHLRGASAWRRTPRLPPHSITSKREECHHEFFNRSDGVRGPLRADTTCPRAYERAIWTRDMTTSPVCEFDAAAAWR